MLALEDVHSSYGSSRVLHGLSMTVQDDKITCLLGRNGMGKSTTLLTIMGVVASKSGRITLDGEAIHGRRPDEIAGRGLTLVPEGLNAVWLSYGGGESALCCSRVETR